MIIGVPREIKDHEFRVGLVPTGVRTLVADGHQVVVEVGAGAGSGISDEDYRAAGAEIVAGAAEVYGQAAMIVKVKEPLPPEYSYLRPEMILFTYLHLAPLPELTKVLLTSGVTAIAYETVETAGGRLPLLAPMSQVAGRLAIQVGAHYLEKEQGGRGILLAGVPGVAPGRVAILGSGTVAVNAAQMAVGLEAETVIIGRNLAKLAELERIFQGRLRIIAANPNHIEKEIIRADLVIGAVLSPGAAAPKLISRQLIAKMQPGAVLVDVAIDQGGCAETSRPTTHSHPVFTVDGVIHYCVANMPGAVPRTSTLALTNATLPYVRQLADLGIPAALRQNPALARGLNVLAGKLTNQPVAEAQGLPWQKPPV